MAYNHRRTRGLFSFAIISMFPSRRYSYDERRARCCRCAASTRNDVILSPMLHIYCQRYVAMIHIILPLSRHSLPSLIATMRIEIAAGRLRPARKGRGRTPATRTGWSVAERRVLPKGRPIRFAGNVFLKLSQTLYFSICTHV